MLPVWSWTLRPNLDAAAMGSSLPEQTKSARLTVTNRPLLFEWGYASAVVRRPWPRTKHTQPKHIPDLWGCCPSKDRCVLLQNNRFLAIGTLQKMEYAGSLRQNPWVAVMKLMGIKLTSVTYVWSYCDLKTYTSINPHYDCCSNGYTKQHKTV